jgi:hypothetical protein
MHLDMNLGCKECLRHSKPTQKWRAELNQSVCSQGRPRVDDDDDGGDGDEWSSYYLFHILRIYRILNCDCHHRPYGDA